jgi:hypothetical protein
MSIQYNKINGPLNVARVEGQIDGINKIMYIFMDYHESIEKETTCKPLFNSTDFMIYLRDNFEVVSKDPEFNKKFYDFFIEIDPANLNNNYDNIHKGRYSDEIDKFVKEVFNFNDINYIYSKDDIIISSNIYSNIRLHFIDIRTAIMLDSLKVVSTLLVMGSKFWLTMSIDKNAIVSIQIQLSYLKVIISELYNGIFGEDLIGDEISQDLKKKIKELIKEKNKKLYDKNKLFDLMKKFISSKIVNKHEYKHQCVHTGIMDILENDIKYNFIKLNTIINKAIVRINKFKNIMLIDDNQLTNHPFAEVNYGIPSIMKRSIIYELTLILDEIHYCTLVEISSKIMDLYFVKQFLDKDYITNSISYTGIDHSVHVLYILVKYFNFNITHISTLNDVTLCQIITKIKAQKKYCCLSKYFFPNVLRQCIDVTEFPKYFQ